MLFDTDVLIWAMRGSHAAADEIDGATARRISAVTYMELMQGARNKREQHLIKHFLVEMGFETLPITESISHRATIIIEEVALKSGVHLADALVFATACEHGEMLVSANQKHFRAVTALHAKAFVPEPAERSNP